MITSGDIYDYLNAFAPVDMQESFDNAGFLFGDRKTGVKTALLALDVTSEVISEAAEMKAELIISHHPVIFGGVKRVEPSDPTGKKLIALAKNDIAVISMHTNLDKAEGGVNSILIRLLGAERNETVPGDPYMRVGSLETETPLAEYLAYVKYRLNANGLRYYDSGRPVSRIACCGGAGGDGLKTAAELGCDTFITADVKYNVFLDARELGINLIDADHFCTENPVMYELKSLLRDRFPEIGFVISERHCQTARFF